MNKNTKRIVIITMLIMVSIFTILFASKELINKNKLPERIDNIVKNKRFAIMIANENGIGYKEYEKDVWPEGYKLAKSECVDNNGDTVDEAISYDESTNKVTLKTKKTVYCTLYFDEDTILNTLRKNDANEVISKELVGDMYRYQGLDKQYSNETDKIVDNNYICFGTDNEEECKNNSDKYMYRIIGITKDDSLKLIKETMLKENNEILKLQWHNLVNVSSPYDGKSGVCDEDKCEWPKARLYNRLNGTSNGNTTGNNGDTNIFVNSSKYNYLNSSGNSYWYNLILSHSWMYGDTNEYIYNGNEMYAKETGKTATKRYWLELQGTEVKDLGYTWSKSITAKIGLMYIHDYLLAYTTGIPGNFSEAKKSWISGLNNKDNNNSAEWVIDRQGLYSNRTFLGTRGIDTNGTFTYNTPNLTNRFGARPVFYLSNNIGLSGNGTIDKPYVII